MASNPNILLNSFVPSDTESIFKPRHSPKETKISLPPIINIQASIRAITPSDFYVSPVKKTTPVKMPVASHVISPVKTVTREANPRTPVLSTEEQVKERVCSLVNNSSSVYDEETSIVKEACLEEFETKFSSLARYYPARNIKLPKTTDLKKIHATYHKHLRDIFVESNLTNVQYVYIIAVMAVEVLLTKIFKLPLSGFAKSEFSRFMKYQSMFIELGHSILPSGQSSQPIEMKMIFMFVLNILIFAGVKILANKLTGGDDLIEMLRTFADKMLEPQVSVEDIELGPEKVRKAQETKGEEAKQGLGAFGDVDNILKMATDFTTVFTSKEEKTQKKGKKYTFED